MNSARRRGLKWARRLGAAFAAVPVLLLTLPGAALAADGAELGQTPPALSWIYLSDSHGISVWNYEMSLDRGGITSPGKIIWSFVIDLFWQLYRSGVVAAIWLIDWVLSFAWLAPLTIPVFTLSRGLSSVVDRFGLPTALLTITAAVAVLWMAKGRWALGIYELFTSLFIASLAVGVLASPVQLVAGNNGMIMQSRDFGLQVANALTNDGQASGGPDALRKNTTGLLADMFIRMPAQTLNFGTVLDGGKCQSAYDKAVKGGPYGTGSEIRDAVAGCDSALGDVAGNPGPGQAVSAVIISPAALFVLLFAIVLAGAVFLAGLYALYQALKAIVTLVTGLLPGSARGALWHTLADLTMSLVTLVFSIVFLTGYLLLIQSVFQAGQPGSGVMATFFFVDILLLAGIVLFWRARKRLRSAAERLAQALATRPGAGPAALPQRQRFDPTRAYYQAKMATKAGRGVQAAAKAAGSRVGVAGTAMAAGGAAAWGRMAGVGAGRGWGSWGPGGGSGGAPGGAPGGGPAGGPSGGPAGGSPAAPAGSAGQRLTALLHTRQGNAAPGGKLLRLGGRTALVVASGGTSTVGTAAAAALAAQNMSTLVGGARPGRRAALLGQLHAGQRALPTGRGDATRQLPAGRGGPTPPPVGRSPGPAGGAAGRTLPPNRGGQSRSPAAGQLVPRLKPAGADRPRNPLPAADLSSPSGVAAPRSSATPPDPSLRPRAALEARRNRPLTLPPAPPRPPADRGR